VNRCEEIVENKIGAVAIIGGGIGGIQASLDLTDLGFKVYLIEKSPSIGGSMAKLDKTFPTNDCALCILAPKMVEVARNPNITLLSYSEVENIEGEAGNFTLKIKKKARYVEESKCKNCGICISKCPTHVPDEFNEGLIVRSAIYIPFPQAVPSSNLIDAEHCLNIQKGVCRLCLKRCEAKAINFDQKDEILTLQVGAVILAPGVSTTSPDHLAIYGHKRFSNVLTSLEYERVLNASGPYDGHVCRPSDHQEPKRIAWLNCIGSRSRAHNINYCSGVCCMYAIKQAMITKEHYPNIECSIFYMDIRAMGKGFEEYYMRAKKEYAIEFINSRISAMEENPENKEIVLHYEDKLTGQSVERCVDLVVLTVGDRVAPPTIELCKKLGVELNKYNFCKSPEFNPLETSTPGIYACGTILGPKDIPETVGQASGAVAEISALLASERGRLTTQMKYPPEIEFDNQEARIGVFICHCGINIGGVVNVPEVVKFVKTLKNVDYAEENIYTCSQDTQDKMKQLIKEKNLNRIIVASCTPRTHESLFQNTIREAGLNPYLFELVNIREHCSWVHMREPLAATEKAKELVAMMVAKARLFKPMKEISIDIIQSAVIIGGGIAGMTAALSLADQGFNVYLLEKEKDLGGFARNIHYTLQNENVQEYLDKLRTAVKNSDKITVLLETVFEDITGYIGNFNFKIRSKEEFRELEAGVVIIATGGNEYKPIEYHYGKSPRILTQSELEKKIINNEVTAKSIVMIQCVGSRDQTRAYCSKLCCSTAIKNALKLKELDPSIEISILHKDIRTPGFKEEYYEKARASQVNFIRFDDQAPPQLELINSKLQVSVTSIHLQQNVVLEPDWVVLSAAFIPSDGVEISQMLKVPLDQNGFFVEAHVKLRPLDFATDGIFLCGSAQYPKFISETIVQAKGAAARAAKILSKESIQIPGNTAAVNERCIGCGICQNVCPYNAIEMELGEKMLEKGSILVYQAHVLEALCKGCGTCAANCPVQAINIPHFTNSQILEMIEKLYQR
jgi:heterodisulfide reductase subunit A